VANSSTKPNVRPTGTLSTRQREKAAGKSINLRPGPRGGCMCSQESDAHAGRDRN
jgi:hypothetical protein